MRSSTKRYANIFIIILTFSVWVYLSFSHRSRRKRVQFIPHNHPDLSIQKEIFTELGYKETTDTYSADFIYLADQSFADALNEIKINASINYLPGTSILTNRRTLYEEFLENFEEEEEEIEGENGETQEIADYARQKLGKFMPETYFLPKDKNRFLFDKENAQDDEYWCLKLTKDHSILAITSKNAYFPKFTTTKNTYIQQIIHPPLVINNRKLLASVFVLIKTKPSLDNRNQALLEHKIYNKDWLFQYAKERYHILLDIVNIDKVAFQEKVDAKEHGTENWITKDLLLHKYLPDFNEIESNVETVIHTVLSSLAELPENKGIYINYFQLLKFNFIFTSDHRPILTSIDLGEIGMNQDGPKSLYIDLMSWLIQELRLV